MPTQTKLIAFHGDQKIKEKYLARVRAHAKADEIVKGTYWENGKGCAVGCTIHAGEHSNYETELGISEYLARIEDGIFESMQNGKSKEWPEKFLDAIPVGADLSLVVWKFLDWLLVDEKNGILKFAVEADKKIIREVAMLCRRQGNGDKPSVKEWSEAAWAAEAAEAAWVAGVAGVAWVAFIAGVAEAVGAAGAAGAAWAAWAARVALVAGAARAARAVVAAGAAEAARAAWAAGAAEAAERQAEKLLELLAEAK